MSGRDRAALDDRCQRGSVRIVQPRRLSRRLAIDQAVRPERVELEHPIANDLKRHTANLRRLGASCAFVNRRQSQKPPCLRAILRSFRGGPDHLRVKIGPKRNGHGEPPLFATLNHLAADSKIPNRVTLSGIWYKGRVSARMRRCRTSLRRCLTRAQSYIKRPQRGVEARTIVQEFISEDDLDTFE